MIPSQLSTIVVAMVTNNRALPSNVSNDLIFVLLPAINNRNALLVHGPDEVSQR
jgi:hypothetical protein